MKRMHLMRMKMGMNLKMSDEEKRFPLLSQGRNATMELTLHNNADVHKTACTMMAYGSSCIKDDVTAISK